jgi:prepilin-type N-terminal cleavage/methylation domain-containing protein
MKRGFTLIELLIVVAIISILSGIAVPNFLEAQVRAKIARIKADARTVATALESYHVDWTSYPFYLNGRDGNADQSNVPEETTYVPDRITTPVAYLTSLPQPVFQAGTHRGGQTRRGGYGFMYRFVHKRGTKDYSGYAGLIYDKTYRKIATRVPKMYDCYYLRGWYIEEGSVSNAAVWVVGSGGPSMTFSAMQRSQAPQWGRPWGEPGWPEVCYDPTNGSTSIGDILRFNAQ